MSKTRRSFGADGLCSGEGCVIRDGESADIVIAGAGAGGMLAAAVLAEAGAGEHVLILEETAEPLRKVGLSGGGRCNLSHACADILRFCENYPRGGRALIGPFHRFGPTETRAWFEDRGVALVTESDGRVFPQEGGARRVIEALAGPVRCGHARLRTNVAVTAAAGSGEGFSLSLSGGRTVFCRRLLVATGGGAWIRGLDHTIEPHVPSLFTFAADDGALCALAGISVPVVLEACGQRVEGPLLVTHEGVSGPAVLTLSSRAARAMADLAYRFRLRIDWLPGRPAEAVLAEMEGLRAKRAGARVVGVPLYGLPGRLWRMLAHRAGLPENRRWGECGRQALRRLADELRGFPLDIKGRHPNRAEFVTCGGVKLAEVDFKTMGSRLHPGLYLAGEVLDIDGLTGGYNLQAAWTTGYLAARALLYETGRVPTG